MNIKNKIMQDINRRLPMACEDILASVESVDFTAFSSNRRNSDNDRAGYDVEDGVATIKVVGLLVPEMSYDMSNWGITGYNHITEYIDEANADPKVNSIVLDVNSTGGYVTGVAACAQVVADSEKPVATHAHGFMQSAAYWLGCAAKTVTASEDTVIGSIGVLATHIEESEAMAKQGIKATIIGSGIWKSAFSSMLPLTDVQVNRMRERVNAQAQTFFSHVAASRNMSTAVIEGLQADSFEAAEAKTLGLIDAVNNKPSINPSTDKASGEYNMDLTQALAEIETLKASNAAKDVQIQEANAKADSAAAAKRDTEITALATSLGREFTAEEKESFVAMDDKGFAFASAFASSLAASAPAAPAPVANPFPTNMFGQQSESGRNMDAKGSGIDAAFAQAKQINVK